MKASIFHRKPDQLETSQMRLLAEKSGRNSPSPSDRNPTALMEVILAHLGHIENEIHTDSMCVCKLILTESHQAERSER